MASTARANGEGSIYQRHAEGCERPVTKTGRTACKCPWQGAIVTGWRGDKPIRRKVSGKTREAVATRLRELRDKVERGQLPHGRVPTVEEWLTYWLEQIVPIKATAGTVRAYTTKVNRHIIPLLGHHRLDKLTPEHVAEAWAHLLTYGPAGENGKGKPLSPTSVHHDHAVLRRALTMAQRRGLIMQNPATLTDAPSRADYEADILTLDQAKAVIATARNQRNAARWTVAFTLGLRKGEARGLRWADVDLDRGILRVRKQIQRIKGQGLQLVPTKGKKERVIALPAPLLADLKAHRKAQNQERLAAGSHWDDGDYLFPQPNGLPVDPKEDWIAWRNLLQAAGVPHVTLHSARHTAATMLLAMGVSVEVVKEIFGHSSITITMRYQHRVNELHVDAASKMAAAFWD